MTERTPLALLAEIVELAAEVWLTHSLRAPNPQTKTERTVRPTPGSRPPTDLGALYATMPAEVNGLRAELVTSVQMVVEEMADEGRTSEIPDWPSDTWAGICAWLRSTSGWWQRQPWASEIESGIRSVHHELALLARVPQDPTYRCAQCGARAHPQPGGEWMRCEAGHEIEGLGAMRRKIQSRPAMTAAEIEAEYRVKPATIRQWHHRELIQPVGQRGRKDLWSVWDVLTLQHREHMGVSLGG